MSLFFLCLVRLLIPLRHTHTQTSIFTRDQAQLKSIVIQPEIGYTGLSLTQNTVISHIFTRTNINPYFTRSQTGMPCTTHYLHRNTQLKEQNTHTHTHTHTLKDKDGHLVTIKHVRDTKPGANTLNPLSLHKASSIVNDNALNAFNCHQLDQEKNGGKPS